MQKYQDNRLPSFSHDIAGPVRTSQLPRVSICTGHNSGVTLQPRAASGVGAVPVTSPVGPDVTSWAACLASDPCECRAGEPTAHPSPSSEGSGRSGEFSQVARPSQQAEAGPSSRWTEREVGARALSGTPFPPAREACAAQTTLGPRVIRHSFAKYSRSISAGWGPTRALSMSGQTRSSGGQNGERQRPQRRSS